MKIPFRVTFGKRCVNWAGDPQCDVFVNGKLLDYMQQAGDVVPSDRCWYSNADYPGGLAWAIGHEVDEKTLPQAKQVIAKGLERNQKQVIAWFAMSQAERDAWDLSRDFREDLRADQGGE